MAPSLTRFRDAGMTPARQLSADNDRHDWGLWETEPWAPETYRRWLDHAHNRAREDSERTGRVVRADAVEMDYFKHGRRLARQRRAADT
jgi:hypothetical protein